MNNEQWMAEAARVAQDAKCLKAHCGAVIVADGIIIGEGYNAPPLDDEKHRMCLSPLRPEKEKYDKTCCVHAEWRAISDAQRRNPEKLSGATLYYCRVNDAGEVQPSGQPYCTVCSRLALDAGLAHFALQHTDGIRLYPTDEYNSLSFRYRIPGES